MSDKSYSIYKVGESRSYMKDFIEFPKRLYRNSDYYIPMFDLDMKNMLKKRHPFFLHSDGEFFLLAQDGKIIGRALITENTRYNDFHKTSFAFFDYFDIIDDQEAANFLFGHLCDWTRQRDLDTLVGPMLSGGAAGAGILIQGFEHTPAMTMMRYNYPYYATILEQAGFEKYLDLNSFYLQPKNLMAPDRVADLAHKVLQRGRFKVLRFNTKADLKNISFHIKDLYDKTLNHHLEDYPLSQEELDQIEKDLLTIADPGLIFLLTYDDKVIGFCLAFSDVSRPLHLNWGKLGPREILRLLIGMKRADKILFNGIGILPEYQGLGGNALLYYEMGKSIASRNFSEGEMVQISEKTELMLKDAMSLGGNPYKIHRMYKKKV